jgi:hypothetical protein
MRKAKREAGAKALRSGIKVELPRTISPITFVSRAVARKRTGKEQFKNREIAKGQNAFCTFGKSTPSSVIDAGNVSICKYSEPTDAQLTDFVTFEGGPKLVNFTLVPIFYGFSWLNSNPNIGDVTVGIQKVLISPYLSQFDQYGFKMVTLSQPYHNWITNQPTKHSTGTAGDIVWDFIHQGLLPPQNVGPGFIVYMVFFAKGTVGSEDDVCGWHDRYLGFKFPADLGYAWVDFPDSAPAASPPSSKK